MRALSPRITPVLVAAIFLAAAGPLHAHAVFSTKGPFFGGLKHFGLSLEDVLAATAIGIVAAQHAIGVTGKSILALAVGWYGCGVIGLHCGPSNSGADFIPALTVLTLGILGAIGRQYRPTVPIGIAAAAGSVHGFLNGMAMQPETLSFGLVQLLGIVTAASFVATYPSALLDLFKYAWVKIAARVLSSWIAATGLLLLGWVLRARK